MIMNHIAHSSSQGVVLLSLVLSVLSFFFVKMWSYPYPQWELPHATFKLPSYFLQTFCSLFLFVFFLLMHFHAFWCSRHVVCRHGYLYLLNFPFSLYRKVWNFAYLFILCHECSIFSPCMHRKFITIFLLRQSFMNFEIESL